MATQSQTEAQSLLNDLIAHVIRSGFEEWSLVSQICDMTTSGDHCALQANLSLAQQLEWRPSVAHKLLRVGRLWAILLHNCGEEFIAYNCSPYVQFLSNLENVLAADDVNPGVSERFLRVLASAVSAFSHAESNHPYAILWTKFKHPGEPVVGFHISASDPLLRPTNSPGGRPSISSSTSPLEEPAPTIPPQPFASTSAPQSTYNQPLSSIPLVSTPPTHNPSPRATLRPLPTLPMTPVAVNRTEVSQKPWNPYPTMPQRQASGPRIQPPRPKSTTDISALDTFESETPPPRPSPTHTAVSSPAVVVPPFTPPPPPPTISSSPALLESPPIHHRRSFQSIIKNGFEKVMKKENTADTEHEPLVGIRYEDTNGDTLPPRPRERPPIDPYATASSASSGKWSDGVLVLSPLERNHDPLPEPAPQLLEPFTSTSTATTPASPLLGSGPALGSAPAVNSGPGLRSTNSSKHPHHRHSSSTDIFSVAHSGLDGLTLNVSIADLCKHIRQSTSSGNASQVRQITWYKEQGGVKHEFLIVKVVGNPNPNRHPSPSPGAQDGDNEPSKGLAPEPTHGQEGQTTWLRLDRAARKGYGGFFQLKSSSAIFPANDTAMVSATETTLQSATSRIQAIYTFNSPPSLHDLEVLLTVIGEESTEYNLFKENCYFFSSVVCSVLGELHQGVISGTPLHPKLGGVVRQQIGNRLRRLSVPYKMGE